VNRERERKENVVPSNLLTVRGFAPWGERKSEKEGRKEGKRSYSE
jgi:hypothetical protein